MIEVVGALLLQKSKCYAKERKSKIQTKSKVQSVRKHQRPEKGQSRKWRDEVRRCLGCNFEKEKWAEGKRREGRGDAEAEEEKRIRESGYAPWCCTKILLSLSKKLPFANADFSFSYLRAALRARRREAKKRNKTSQTSCEKYMRKHAHASHIGRCRRNCWMYPLNCKFNCALSDIF